MVYIQILLVLIVDTLKSSHMAFASTFCAKKLYFDLEYPPRDQYQIHKGLVVVMAWHEQAKENHVQRYIYISVTVNKLTHIPWTKVAGNTTWWLNNISFNENILLAAKVLWSILQLIFSVHNIYAWIWCTYFNKFCDNDTSSKLSGAPFTNMV